MGACTAIFVQRRLDGGWHVWQGSTQNDDPPPAVASMLHYGVFSDRGTALCEAHDRGRHGLPVDELGAERPKPATVDDLRRLIADDAWAASFQTLRQYREALLSALRI